MYYVLEEKSRHPWNWGRLFRGADRGGSPFWGEPATFLGWYADVELVAKEMKAIRRAITEGRAAHTLQYSAKTRQSLTGVKLVEA